MSASPLLALAGPRIYRNPSDPPIDDGVIVVEGTQIVSVGTREAAAIPTNAKVLDCTSCTIMAGFWNCHVHFFERKWIDGASTPADELGRQLQGTFTRYGFTTVFDLGSKWENTRALRDRIDSREVAGPRIYSTGEGLLPLGALPSDDVLRVMGFASFPAPEVSDELAARAAARRLLEAGVDAVKIFASSPRSAPLSYATVAAAVDEAHKANKRVFIHPNSGADVVNALRAGVDVIAHTTPYSGPWNQEIVGLALERGGALTPTLTLWQHFLRHDRLSTQEEIVQTALAQLRLCHDAGATVLFGTDVGAVEPDPTQEYLLMTQAGLPFQDILASLTTTPAAYFGDSNGGTIAAGQLADLTIVNGDPGEDISALVDVRYTIRKGEVIYGELAALI